MGKNKVKEFVKNHEEKAIAIGAISAIGVGAMIMLGVRVLKTTIKNIDIPDTWSVGTITDLWTEHTWTNAIISDITVADLGKLGEEFQKINGVKPDTVVSAVVSLLRTVE